MTKKDYQTTNLYLAAFLLSKNIKWIDHVNRGKHTEYYFEDTDETQALIDDFVRDTMENVCVADFVSSLRKLKSVIYE